jgi:glutamine synthetase
VEENVFEMPESEREARAIQTLPGSLIEAIEVAESSPFLREALGEHTYASLLRNKRIEWERYRRHISDYELREYLPIL